MKTKDKALLGDLRETLKALMQKEIENLPHLLESLEPKDRLNIVCKMLPYVFPKVEAVHSAHGEPDSWT
ncbi:hypothetical protein J2I47_15240 [Fibrella sp. HMF5335]|uniref:Uncharacterized protein n=1 Tax=Fibrella rubiginis TaxID=2817060 RepID=A0A939GJH5_9BACT|nr:hypothetical protein [Fibrella rubiginis]MBO0937911.1 hypothetical protein [Fibrella rubiginis]